MEWVWRMGRMRVLGSARAFETDSEVKPAVNYALHSIN